MPVIHRIVLIVLMRIDAMELSFISAKMIWDYAKSSLKLALTIGNS